MKIMKDDKLDLQALKDAIKRPEIWKPSTGRFWDDEYISLQMLKQLSTYCSIFMNHLDDTMIQPVRFISLLQCLHHL